MKVVIEAGNLSEAAKLALQYDLGRFQAALDKEVLTSEDVSQFLVQRLQKLDIGNSYAKSPTDVPCVYGVVFALPLLLEQGGEEVLIVNLAVRPKTADRGTQVLISA